MFGLWFVFALRQQQRNFAARRPALSLFFATVLFWCFSLHLVTLSLPNTFKAIDGTDMYNLLTVPPPTSLKRLVFLCAGCEVVTVRSQFVLWMAWRQWRTPSRRRTGRTGSQNYANICRYIIHDMSLYQSETFDNDILWHRCFTRGRDVMWRCIRRFSERDSGSFWQVERVAYLFTSRTM